MQKLFLFIGFSCLLAAPGAAHADKGSTFLESVTLGGKLGVSAVTLGGENPGGTVFQPAYKPSYAAGGFANVALYEALAVQLEILFAAKGGNQEEDGTYRGSWNLDYIELPLLIRGRYPLLGNFDIHGLFGPELSFLLKAEIEDEDGDTADFTDDSRTLDVGLIFGTGVTWHHSRQGAIVVEARYDLGLRSISRNPEIDARNRALTVMLGYQWALGAK